MSEVKRQLLREYRGSRNQADMAEIYGTTQQSWSQWEKGISTPKLAIMKKISDDSKIPMDVLFADSFNNL